MASDRNERRYREVRRALISGHDYVRIDGDAIRIDLPHGCGARGSVHTYRGAREAYLSQVSVSRPLRSRGLGSIILRLFADVAQEAGASSLYGDIITASSLKCHLRAFSSERMTFREIPTDYPNGRSRRIRESVDVLIEKFQPLRVHVSLERHKSGTS